MTCFDNSACQMAIPSLLNSLINLRSTSNNEDWCQTLFNHALLTSFCIQIIFWANIKHITIVCKNSRKFAELRELKLGKWRIFEPCRKPYTATWCLPQNGVLDLQALPQARRAPILGPDFAEDFPWRDSCSCSKCREGWSWRIVMQMG